jgi:hypothetical protein
VKIEKLKSKKTMIEAEDPGVMKVGTRNQVLRHFCFDI